MYQACPNSIMRKNLDPTTDAGIAKMKMYNKLFDLAFAEPGRQLTAKIKYKYTRGSNSYSGVLYDEQLLNLSLEWDGGLSGCVMKSLTFEVADYDFIQTVVTKITETLFGVYVDPAKYEEEMTASGYDVSGLSPEYYYIDYGAFWVDYNDSNTGYSYKDDKYSFQCYDAISQLSLPSTKERTHKMWKKIKSYAGKTEAKTSVDYLMYFLLTGKWNKTCPASAIRLSPGGDWRTVYEGMTAREAIDDFALALNWLIVAQNDGYLIINSRKIDWSSDAKNVYFHDENYDSGVWLDDSDKRFVNDYDIYIADENALTDYQELKPTFIKTKTFVTGTNVGDVTATIPWGKKPAYCNEAEITISPLCLQGECKYFENKFNGDGAQAAVINKCRTWARRWLKVNDGDENYKVDYWYMHSFEANSMPRVSPCDPIQIRLPHTTGYTRAMSNIVNYEGGYSQTVAFDDLSLHGGTLEAFNLPRYEFDDKTVPSDFVKTDWGKRKNSYDSFTIDYKFGESSAFEIKFTPSDETMEINASGICGSVTAYATEVLGGHQLTNAIECNNNLLRCYIQNAEGVTNVDVTGDYAGKAQTVYFCRKYIKHNGVVIFSNTNAEEGMVDYSTANYFRIFDTDGVSGASHFSVKPFKVYYFKYWENGVLKCHLVPGNYDSPIGGTASGFYDKVSGKHVGVALTVGNDEKEVTK